MKMKRMFWRSRSVLTRRPLRLRQPDVGRVRNRPRKELTYYGLLVFCEFVGRVELRKLCSKTFACQQNFRLAFQERVC